MTYFTSGALYWMKQLFIFEKTLSRTDVLFLMGICRLYLGFKKSFEHNSVRKNQFLSASFCWDSSLSLRELDQKYKFGRTIGFGDSYLAFLFRRFKVFKLHAILQDAAGAVRAQRGKGPGKLHDWTRTKLMFARSREWITFCLYVKVFLPSILNSVDFWNSMSLILLHWELTEKDVIKELGPYIDGSLQGLSFCPPKTFKPNKQTTWNASHLHGIAWSSK